MKNLQVYKSAAGSGKTFALVQSILLNILSKKDPSYYRHILALTFTNKAANEMKERLLIFLKILAKILPEENHPIVEAMKNSLKLDADEIQRRATQILEHMIHNYSDLALTTIDKFNHKIVRQFSRDLQLEHDFDVELEEGLIVEQAVDVLLSQIGNDQKTTDLLLNYVLFNIDQELNWSLRFHLINYGKLLIKESNRPALHAMTSLSSEHWEAMRKKLKSELKTASDNLIKQGKSALDLISKSNILPEKLKGGKNKAIHGFFLKAAKGEFFNPDDTGSKYMLADEWHAGKANESDKSAIDEMKGELFAVFESIYRLLKPNQENNQGYTYFNSLGILLKESYPMEVILLLDNILNDLKIENNFILISDINQKINDVVMNNPTPFIYEKLGERYNNYYLDEFQDTSVMQWNNMIPLLEDSLSKANLNFLVGDSKQAIYRFRGGQAKQLTGLPMLPFFKNDHSTWTEKTFEKHYQENILEKNYRSAPEIVEFNNHLFQTYKSVLPESISTYYNQHQQIPTKEDRAYVEINFSEQYKDVSVLIEKIVDYVNEIVADGYLLSDIAILVRTSRQGQKIANHLLGNSIPVLSADSLLLNENKDVSLVLNWIRLTVDKENSGAALSLFQHCLKHFGHEELKAYRQNHSLDFFKYLKQSKKFSVKNIGSLPLIDQAVTIIKLLDLSQFNPYLEAFLSIIHEFVTSQGNNSVKFLQYWEERKNNFSLPAKEESNAVRILTIHKAKGLQFPVVIVPLLGPGKGRSNYVWVNSGSLVNGLDQMLVSLNKDLENSNFKNEFEEERKNQILDELNILYVAFTRPQQRLYALSPKPSEKSDTIESILKNGLLKAIHTFQKQNGNSDVLILGERKTVIKKNNIEAPKFKPFQTGNYRQTIPFGRLSNLEPELEQPGAMRFGAMVHALLAEMESFEDLNNSIQNLKVLFSLSIVEQTELEELIAKMGSNEVVKNWFLSGNSIKNEAEILTENGKIYRPDRLIFGKDELLVIDFKTGDPRNEHKLQILKYKTLLEEMGYTTIQAYLCYLKNEIEIISL